MLFFWHHLLGPRLCAWSPVRAVVQGSFAHPLVRSRLLLDRYCTRVRTRTRVLGGHFNTNRKTTDQGGLAMTIANTKLATLQNYLGVVQHEDDHQPWLPVQRSFPLYTHDSAACALSHRGRFEVDHA